MLLYSGREEQNIHHTQVDALILSKEARQTPVRWEPYGSRIIKASFKIKSLSQRMLSSVMHTPLIATSTIKISFTRACNWSCRSVWCETRTLMSKRRYHRTTRSGIKKRDWWKIYEFLSIQQNGHGWHNIAPWTRTRSYMGFSRPHCREPDWSFLNREQI